MSERKRPNIVFIMSDDHASHAMSCYGSRINTTPNLDRIAAGGMRFDNCFCTNSICTPSRAAILAGTYRAPAENRFARSCVNRLRLLAYTGDANRRRAGWQRQRPATATRLLVAPARCGPATSACGPRDSRQSKTSRCASDDPHLTRSRGPDTPDEWSRSRARRKETAKDCVAR